MTHTMNRAGSLLVLLLLAACGPAEVPAGDPDAEAVIRTLRSVEAEINAGRLLEAVQRYWADDHVQMSADVPPGVMPRDSLLARYAARQDSVAFGWAVHAIDGVYVSGDLASARVRADWSETPHAAGPPTVYRQELFYVLRRDGAGWRLLVEAWNDLEGTP